jgi:hypothetical protein
MHSDGPKIGLIDIETAPLVVDAWGLFDQNIGLNQVNVEWSILSFCFKELHGKRSDVLYMDTQGDPRNDEKLLPVLWQLMHDYDYLVAQNGKRFDMRKIRARLIMENLPPHSPVKVQDTMLMARKVAAFTSNKLEWLSTYLSAVQKSKHKDFPGHELWTECLRDNPKAWKSMRKYNIPDVLSMEDIYLRLRPWTNDMNVAVYTDDEHTVCPCCGSNDLVLDGFAHTNVSKYNRYRCNMCGGWSRDRYTTNSRAKRKSLLASI